jgi:hypothetical protein
MHLSQQVFDAFAAFSDQKEIDSRLENRARESKNQNKWKVPCG